MTEDLRRPGLEQKLTDSTWDSKNRLDVLTYPGPSNRLAVKHTYHVRDYLDEIKNNGSSALYYRATAMDARGNITGESHGSILKTTVGTYQCGAGNRMDAVCQITAGSVGLETASYNYDPNGSMPGRSEQQFLLHSAVSDCSTTTITCVEKHSGSSIFL